MPEDLVVTAPKPAIRRDGHDEQTAGRDRPARGREGGTVVVHVLDHVEQ